MRRASEILCVEVSAGRGRERLLGAGEFRGWLPVDAFVDEGRPRLKWLDMAGVSFEEPFFQQTVERVRRERPGGAERLTDFDALVQVEKVVDSLRPTGFIFHASRCGSTLVSNACRVPAGSHVIAEAGPVDKLVWQYLAGDDGRGTLSLLRRLFLRAAVNVLGQKSGAGARHFFVKFSCCSVLQLSFVRRIWPEVPWVFVYRDPVEILVSNLRTPPEWMTYEEQPPLAAAVSGLAGREAVRLGREEFCARALGRFYASAAESAGADTLLVGHDELSGPKLLEVLKFFGVSTTAGEAEEVFRTSRLYAKDPARARAFEPDAAGKRAAASPLALEMAERWAREPYQRLLAKKKALGTRKAV